MAKKHRTDGVYRVIDAIGTSKTAWQDAARQAVDVASSSPRDLRIAEVAKMDMEGENGKLVPHRTRVPLAFKYES